ncbi:MAG: LacI family DNA-binding transcriptional regulator [Pseudomonadota bacterium]
MADKAGVSIKTVSRVLNNEPNVREQTRDKVKLAVSELNYVPDVSARSLAGQRSYMCAMFYDTASEGYLSRFQKGALDACRAQNYHLVVEQCRISETNAVERLVATATQLRVDGIALLPPLSDTEDVLERFSQVDIPTILIAPGGRTFSMPSVRMDDEAAASDITKLLIRHGHHRIGFIKGHADHGATPRRLRGYIEALRIAEISDPSELIVRGDFSFESGLVAAEQLLSLDAPPTAIFASNDDMAAAAIRVAIEKGYSVPKDLSVVGFDDALIASATVPPLTTVRQPIEAMAAAAFSKLLAVAANRDAESNEEAQPKPFEYKIVERSSIGRGPFRSSSRQHA